MPATHETAGQVGSTTSSSSSSSSPAPSAAFVSSAVSPQASSPTGTVAGTAPGASAGGAPPDMDRTASGLVVGIILSGVVMAALAMVTFIWYRWHDVHDPTTAVIIDGDETLEGTIITVSGGRREIRTTLRPQTNYVAPVLVEPGTYTVMAERDGLMLLHKEVTVKRFLGVRFPLALYVREAIEAGILPPLQPRGKEAPPARTPAPAPTSAQPPPPISSDDLPPGPPPRRVSPGAGTLF